MASKGTGETKGKGAETIWLATCPKSLAHLSKFPEAVQEMWRLSRLKEFKSIIGKGAAEVVNRRDVPPNAILIPSSWVFKLKLDGTLKSRLVLLGHLMPKDAEVDLSSPTPRLSSVRFLLTLVLKMNSPANWRTSTLLSRIVSRTPRCIACCRMGYI